MNALAPTITSGVLKCPSCDMQPLIKVGTAGYVFAVCDGCGRSTWPAPCASGTDAVAAWNRSCSREFAR